MHLVVRGTRLLLRAAWVMSIAAVIALIAVAQIGPRDGRSIFIVHGQSMTPTIAIGSLVVVVPATATELQAGDIVSLRSGSTVVTHRIIGVDDSTGERQFVTKGDANESADAVPVGSSAVVGRVAVWLPFVGFGLAFLGSPLGIIAVLSFLGTLMMANWLLDDSLVARRRTVTPRGFAGEAPV